MQYDKSYIRLFKTFFLIGTFTIGGGQAMIPMMQKEIVEKYKWLTDDEFIDVIALAQSAPGPVAVNMSVYLGLKLRGGLGALATIMGTVLPSFLIMILVATIFKQITDVKIVKDAFYGMRAAVFGVIAATVVTIGEKSKLNFLGYFLVIIVAVLNYFLGLSPIALILAGGFGYIIIKILGAKNGR